MKNKYEIRGDVTEIIINSPKYGRLETLISTNKLERVLEFPCSWYATFDKRTKSFYVHGSTPAFNGKRTTVPLHRWITNAPDGMFVDHRNHDTLNNTNDNLKICTNSENQQNRKGPDVDNNSSGVRGVSWNKRHGKWYSQITVNGKQIYLGCFKELSEAESAAKEARAKYMPFSSEAG